MSALLQARHVTKQFPRRRRWIDRLRRTAPDLVTAVHRVSLTVNAGEIVGLIGESGSGKTTLARMLVRLTSPTSGDVYFRGQSLAELSGDDVRTTLRRQVRYVFQHPDAALNPAFTVEQVLLQALAAHTALPPAARHARVPALLTDVGLSPSYRESYAHTLSGGEKRRVGIARALATEPLLLVADEPTSGLDVALQRQILALLQRLRDEHGLALLLISHDLGLVRSLCDRVGVMRNGRLVEIGPRDAITPERCQHPYTHRLLSAQLSRLSTDDLSPHAPASSSSPARGGCVYRRACRRWRERGKPEQCRAEVPTLQPIDARPADHHAACHFAESTPSP